MTKDELFELAAVKSLGMKRVGGYGILWGNEQESDVFGEWFTPNTSELTSIFEAIRSLPMLYNHAMDDSLKSSVIGTIDVLQSDDIGIWYEAQLNMSNKYLGAFMKLLKDKKLGSSSGTLPRAREVAKSGEVIRWPIIEISSTPAPADLRHIAERPLSVVKSFYQEAGIDTLKVSEVMGRWETDDDGTKAGLLDILSYDLWAIELINKR